MKVVMSYALVLLVFGAVGCVIYFLRHKKNKKHGTARMVPAVETKKNSPKNSKFEVPVDDFIDNLVEVPARIYDNATRSVKNGMLSANEVRQIRKDFGNLGRRWYQNGDWRYAAVRLSDGTCKPVQKYMSLSLKNPPERLHRALQQEETESFYKPRDNRSVLAKYGAYLLFAGAVIVILFLWGANMLKG